MSVETLHDHADPGKFKKQISSIMCLYKKRSTVTPRYKRLLRTNDRNLQLVVATFRIGTATNVCGMNKDVPVLFILPIFHGFIYT
jgi:hypothetical protein